MDLAHHQTKAAAKSLQVNVRTVTDVEVGAAVTSPPATEQDRADFQKLLFQMNGLGVTQKASSAAGGSKRDSKNHNKEAVKMQGKQDAASNDQEKQKKKRGKRSAKKSNKSSPDDSPQKLATSKNVEKSIENSSSMKKEDHIPLAENTTSTFKASTSNPLYGAAKQSFVNQTKSAKAPKPKAVKRPEISKDSREPDTDFQGSQGKLRDSEARHNSQEVASERCGALTVEKSIDNSSSARKEELISVAEKISSTFKASTSNPLYGAAKQSFVNQTKSAKAPKQKAVKKPEISNDSREPDIDFQVSQGKRRDSEARHISREVATDRRGSGTRGGDHSLQLNIDNRDPFEKQPLMLLKAAVNLIKPKKKIVAVNDSNLLFCIPCDKFFNDLNKHLEKSKDQHRINWKCEMRQRTIDFLPDFSEEHIRELDNLVTSTVLKCKLPQDQYEISQSLWQSLDKLAKSKFDCSVRWFGSHVNDIALSGNNLLNMDLLVPSKEEAASTFLCFISSIEESFKDVERVVASNFAHANISYKGLEVQLSLNNNGAYSTAKLIGDYISIDKRVQPLCIFFRYWGKLCGLDQGENGSWQGHAFPIMVIHFLQQRNVLPVLHDLVDNPEGAPEVYLDPKDLQGNWQSGCNSDSLGKLGFEMFRYYAIEHDVEKHVVCITQFKPFLRTATKWTAKRIAVIDPFQPKHNISRYVSAHMYDYIHFCLLSTTCALGIPRTLSKGPLFGYIGPRPEPSCFDQTPSVREEYMEVSENVFELVRRSDNYYDEKDQVNNTEICEELRVKLLNSDVYKELRGVLRVVPSFPLELKSPYSCWWVTPYQANHLHRHLRPGCLSAAFTRDLCTDSEPPPITCTACHRGGHLRSKCPDEIIPKMRPVSPPSPELSDCLNRLCLDIFETRCTEDSALRDRMDICDDLMRYLKQYYPDINLHLFGSSLNGFGGRSSDIDMCLTFQSNATGEGLNFPAIVEEIENRLKGHRSIYQLVAITTAKVPIVKFSYGRARIQVDISLYNRLGIMNTRLLHAYSVIDRRVRPLVYMMKTLAKTTGLGDASRGSLSSYAYSLMSLYFLQQVEPPVIPVLQELHDPNVGPKVELVEGANVYFFSCPERLDEVWPHRGKNKSSLAELWLQLLEFYATEKFHYSQRVVCIRKKDPLYKFDKLWTSTNICIEDPFDRNHNLGSGLSKRMNIFIVKTFQKACKHFSSVPKQGFPSLEKYYFNENALSVGKPPSDRGCHYCRSIGHLQNDCPKRLMMQQRMQPQPNGRVKRGPNGPNGRQANHGFENLYHGGNRPDPRDPRNHRDVGRISNMPSPMPLPIQMQNCQPVIRPVAPKHPNQQNPRKPMNIQNHLVVGSMKPPGFPAIPPGYYVGAPMRLLSPQMAQQMHAQHMQVTAPPSVASSPTVTAPPSVMNRPTRPFPW